MISRLIEYTYKLRNQKIPLIPIYRILLDKIYTNENLLMFTTHSRIYYKVHLFRYRKLYTASSLCKVGTYRYKNKILGVLGDSLYDSCSNTGSHSHTGYQKQSRRYSSSNSRDFPRHPINDWRARISGNSLQPIERTDGVDRLEVNRVLFILENLRVRYGDAFLCRLLIDAERMINRHRIGRAIRDRNRLRELFNPTIQHLTPAEERLFIDAIVQDALARRRIYRHEPVTPATPHCFRSLSISNAIQAETLGAHIVHNAYRAPILPIPPPIEYFVVEASLAQYMKCLILDSYHFPIKLIPNLLPCAIFPNKYAILKTPLVKWFTNPFIVYITPLFLFFAGFWIDCDPSELAEIIRTSGILRLDWVRYALGLNHSCTHIENPTAIYEAYHFLKDISASMDFDAPEIHRVIVNHLTEDIQKGTVGKCPFLLGGVLIAFICLIDMKDPTTIQEILFHT